MMIWIWGIITACALILEFVTADLISIWFAAGGLVSLLCAAIFKDLPIVWQCTIFVLTSCILLLCTRKIFKKLTKGENEKTNTDSFVGKKFKIGKVIDKDLVYHKIADVEWKVVSESEEVLTEGQLVEIIKISGNKLVVKILKEKGEEK